MKSQQEIQDAARAIISFTDSNTYNNERQQNESPESESTLFFRKISSTLQSLINQILENRTCKQAIQIQNLYHSLSTLIRFKLGAHLKNKEEDEKQLRFEVKYWNRQCLFCIQQYGDAQDLTERINIGYGRLMIISISTTGGSSEEQDQEIYYELIYISNFIYELHEGRSKWQPSFQPLPLLARSTEEQIEEEGGNEEVDAQMNNNGNYGNIKRYANEVKAATLNRFFHSS
ncbi:MAG: hypothetical protein EZS28_041323 [Streblomastix strix]|uniref:Uncharacterized protein n=1 Tax=Streblomastix strix TaxID=222440 RepID=A0A5J4TZQ1_9EUKA|nr:MAG: hypothetical protein EZS28_041323 [Streblomastix strix]